MKPHEARDRAVATLERVGLGAREVALIVAIALVPALLAALLPARMASHIEPARALRIHD